MYFRYSCRISRFSSEQLIREAGVSKEAQTWLFSFILSTPQTKQLLMTLSSFTDDKVSHNDPVNAAENLQTHFNELSNWYSKWSFKVNEIKSVLITFSKTRNLPLCNI